MHHIEQTAAAAIVIRKMMRKGKLNTVMEEPLVPETSCSIMTQLIAKQQQTSLVVTSDDEAPMLTPVDDGSSGSFPAVRVYRHDPYSYRVCATTEQPHLNNESIKVTQKAKKCSASVLQHRNPHFKEPRQQQNATEEPSRCSATRQKVMCCYYKQKGYCKMGEKCWYGHDGDLYTPCHYGASCVAGHATLALMAEMGSTPLVSVSLSVAPSTTNTHSLTSQGMLNQIDETDVPCEHC